MENDMNSSTGTALADGSPDFMAVSRKLADEKGIGITQAMRRVHRERSGLHREFLQKAQSAILEKKAPRGKRKGNKDFMAVARARAKRTGESLTKAMRQVAHDHPWLFAGDIDIQQPAVASRKVKAQTPQEVMSPSSPFQPGKDDENGGDEDDGDEDDADDAENVSESRNTNGGELGDFPAGTSILVAPAGRMQAEFIGLALSPEGQITSLPGFSGVQGPTPLATRSRMFC